jgi:xylobiose transport system substrate-binding protein
MAELKEGRVSVRNRRRFGATIPCLTIVALLGALTACGDSTSGTDERSGSSVRVWALLDPNNEPVIQRGIQHFNADSGTGARLTTYANDDYKAKLQSVMGSDNAPDVFFNWGGGNLAQFVRAGQVQPLTTALAQRPDVAKAFVPSVLAVGKVDGVQYALPINGVQPVILFYNKQVFSAVGASPPQTYDDLLDLVDTFSSHGVTPIALAGAQGWTELMWLEYLLDRVGGANRFADIVAGKANAWQHKDVIKALKMCQELATAGAFGKDFASVNYDTTGASRRLATGKAAMHLMGSWEYANLSADNASFIKNGGLGWVAFPSVPGGAGNPKGVVGNPSNYFAVRAKSPVVDAATRFVVDTFANDGYINDLIDSGQVPAVQGIEGKLSGKNSGFAQFTYNLVKNSPTFTQSWDQALSPAVGAALNENLRKLFQGEISPTQFAAAMQKA